MPNVNSHVALRCSHGIHFLRARCMSSKQRKKMGCAYPKSNVFQIENQQSLSQRANIQCFKETAAESNNDNNTLTNRLQYY